MSNYASFNSVETIDPVKRAQQYGYNGRIFISPEDRFPSYDIFKDSTKPQNTDTSIISNIVVPTAVSRTFFSNDNMERIQQQIIAEVAKVSNKQIGKQSYTELQVIMKSMYLQYGKNLPYDIESQVAELNKMVVDTSVNIIVPNVLQYEKYLQDISSPIPIMPRSQNVSNKGYKFGDFSSLIPSVNSTQAFNR